MIHVLNCHDLGSALVRVSSALTIYREVALWWKFWIKKRKLVVHIQSGMV